MQALLRTFKTLKISSFRHGVFLQLGSSTGWDFHELDTCVRTRSFDSFSGVLVWTQPVNRSDAISNQTSVFRSCCADVHAYVCGEFAKASCFPPLSYLAFFCDCLGMALLGYFGSEAERIN